MSHMNERFVHLGGGGAWGEASKTMVELCMWSFIVLLHKLVMYCDYISHILHKTFFALGLQKREKT
jgi:hypothetical protein